VKCRALSVCALATTLLVLTLQPAGAASSKSAWEPNTSTFWGTGAGGDNYRTGYAPSEKRPPFFTGSHGTNGSNGPWLQWQTKIADLPSGVFPGAAIAVAYGLVYVSGGSTNSFLALDENTGMPVWRFQPDNRSAGYTGQYPATNAPVVHDGIVYMSFSNGWVYALDARTGRKIWSAETDDFYKGPQSVGGSLPADPYSGGTIQNDPNRKIGTGPFDPIHPPVAYSKIHGVTSYCDGKIFIETLAGYMHGYDAKTGRALFKPVYVDNPNFPGELTWYEYPTGGALNKNNASNGSSTRRFEAVAGLGCVHHEILVLGSDGHLRWYDPNTGKKTDEYNRVENNIGGTGGQTDFCQSAGYNCDAAIGQADPVSGDYFVTTLDSRMIRITPGYEGHKRVWYRSYSAPLPFQVGNTLPLSLPHTEVGFVTEAVVGSPSAEDVKRRVMYVPAQDGHIYALDISGHVGGGVRPNDPMGPTLLSVTGISLNTEPRTPYTPPNKGGPWDYNQQALAGLVLGGDVLYVPTWDNRITAYRADDPRNLQKIWTWQVTTDPNFQYPPFGDTFGNTYFAQNDGQPFTDLDNKIFSTPALLNGHLFFAANDGSVYSFDLMHPEKTVRNLAILGQGLVPFIPKWTQPVGAFDRVWTPADWYKNQVAPAGYRLPKPAGVATATGFLWLSAALWWWMRRRDDIVGEPDEAEGDTT